MYEGGTRKAVKQHVANGMSHNNMKWLLTQSKHTAAKSQWQNYDTPNMSKQNQWQASH